MGDSKVSQFDNIYFGISNHIGKLRMAVNGIGWKAAKIEKLHTIKSDEMSRFYWMRSIKQYELSIATKDGNVTRFLNFQRDVININIFFYIIYLFY
jgi:structure-specific recognition protein 1